MKKALLVILGIIVLLIGMAATLGGTGLVVAFGSQGELETPVGKTDTGGYALALTEFDVQTGNENVRDALELSFGGSSPDGRQLFAGIAPTEQVAQYLRGVPYAAVSSVDVSGTTDKVEIPGTGTPKPPQEQTFWTKTAVGTNVLLPVDPAQTSQTLVIMNADGAAAVAAELELGIQSPVIFPLGIGLIGFGGIFIILAIWLFVRAGRKKRRSAANLPPGAYPPAAYPGGAYPPEASPSVLPGMGSPAAAPGSGGWPVQPGSGGWPAPAQPPAPQPPAPEGTPGADAGGDGPPPAAAPPVS